MDPIELRVPDGPSLRLDADDCFHATYPLQRLDVGGVAVALRGRFWDAEGRAMPPERVAARIARRGQDALRELDGSFCVAATDPARNAIWCATDPKGFMSVFHAVQPDGTLRVANDAARLASLSPSRALDPDALLALFNAGYPFGAQTLFRDVRALLPGALLEWRAGRVATRHWFWPAPGDGARGFEGAADVLATLDAILAALHAREGRWLLPLSGGVDSRLLALRATHLGIPFDAVTIPGRIGRRVPGSDFDVAARVAKLLGARHEVWDWDARDAVANVTRLAVQSGGMNSALFTYADGLAGFGRAAAGHGCALRGDETFGWDEYSWSPAHALYVLNVHASDDLARWTPGGRGALAGRAVTGVLARESRYSPWLRGDRADAWKQEFYWQTRIPRYIFPIARWQAAHLPIALPYLEKRFLHRMHVTAPALRADKRVVREALALASREVPGMAAVPFAAGPSFAPSEPVENLPSSVKRALRELLVQPTSLDEYLDKRALSEALSLAEPADYVAPARPPRGSGEPLVRRARRALKPLANALGVMPATRVHPTLLFVRALAAQLYLLNAPA